MDLSSQGIISGSHMGYLDLDDDLADSLVCTDPITDHFEVEETPFARGKFAAVRRVRCLRTGEYYAAKIVRKRRRAMCVKFETLHEAAVLALAQSNSCIVNLHRVFEGPSEMILVLELAAGGELQRIIDEEERIEESVVKKYLKQILQAVKFLHSNRIAHLDLKPQNLLLSGPHPVSDVKLCDFGISRVILADIELREVLGTPDYVAPEILQYEPISLATDMWSVGVLAYVLLSGCSPFGGDTKQETFLNITQCQLDFPSDIFNGISKEAIDFISKLVVVEPECRLTVDEALSDLWLSSSDPISLYPVPSEPLTFDEIDLQPVDLQPVELQSQPSLKRPPTSPPALNKENDKNILNGYSNGFQGGIDGCSGYSNYKSGEMVGLSPPSKRECRDKEGEPKAHKTVVEVSLSPQKSSNKVPKTKNVQMSKSPGVQRRSNKVQNISPTPSYNRIPKISPGESGSHTRNQTSSPNSRVAGPKAIQSSPVLQNKRMHSPYRTRASPNHSRNSSPIGFGSSSSRNCSPIGFGSRSPRICSTSNAQPVTRSGSQTRVSPRMASQSGSMSPVPPSNKSHVTKQVRSIERKIKSLPRQSKIRSPPKEEIISDDLPGSSNERVDGSDAGKYDSSSTGDSPSSISNIKAKFSNQLNVQIGPAKTGVRRNLNKNSLNRSFGSVDQRPKDCDKMRENLRLSPLCIRRDNCEGKFGARRDFQDIVIKNDLIY